MPVRLIVASCGIVLASADVERCKVPGMGIADLVERSPFDVDA